MRRSPHQVRERLTQGLAEGGLLLDGAMGSALAASAIMENGPPLDRLNLTAPQTVGALHRAYLAAGAEFVRTNTFNAAAIALTDRTGGLEIVRAGVALAVSEADAAARSEPARRRFVGASFGLVHAAAIPPGRPSGAIEDAFAGVVGAALDAGADLVFIETVFDLAALAPALSGFAAACAGGRGDVPLVVSASPAAQAAALPSGESLSLFCRTVEPFAPAAIGLNCGFGAAAMGAVLASADFGAGGPGSPPLALYPNAGLPDASVIYPEDAQNFAARTARLGAGRRVALIGGCCGTTPAHIRALSDLRRGAASSA